MVAWGIDCKAWHDSVDDANRDAFDFGHIPEDRFVITTWHNREPLSEALWFAGFCANHPDVKLNKTMIIHVASEEQSSGMLETYRDSQTMVPT